MCLIAWRSDPATHIPKTVIDSNKRMNPDGFGLAYREDDGYVYYLKYGPDQAAEFTEKLLEIDDTPKEYVAHFRKGTSGANSKALAHPFPYEDDAVGTVLVFHNGIIPIRTSGPNESDTSVFVDSVISELPSEWWKDDTMRFLVEQSASGSRLLLMTVDDIILLNKDSWTEKGGILYSTFPTGFYGGYSSGSYGWNRGDDDDDYIYGVNPKYAPLPKVENVPADDSHIGVWEHGGHDVEPAPGYELEADGTAWCNTCGEDGDFLTLDGKVYIEMRHAYPIEGLTDEEELVKVVEIAKLYKETGTHAV